MALQAQTREKIDKLLAADPYGMITPQKVQEAGLQRGILRQLTEENILTRISRGIYIRSEVWEDDLYLLQKRYRRGIFSHETALYLHGFSDRYPLRYTITFPKGYNAPSLKQELVNVVRVKSDYYSLGVIEKESLCGNPIRIYDLERTLCDIVRGSHGDIEIILPAMKKYAVSRNKSIYKLMNYAEKLHVEPKIIHYMEVLL